MKKILFVCLGNICRSSSAEEVMRTLIRKEGLEREIEVDSLIKIRFNTPCDIPDEPTLCAGNSALQTEYFRQKGQNRGRCSGVYSRWLSVAPHDVRQTPLPDETWAAHTPAGPRLFPSMLRSMFPEKLPAFRTGEPSDSQGRFLLKKNSLSACVLRTDRKAVFFSAEGPGCFTGRPWLCFP